MYIVKTKSGEVVAICSRKEDASAFLSAASVDKQTYIISKV